MAEEGGKAGDTAFTAGETLLLITIMQNLTSNMEFDAEAVAQKLNYKNRGIVKTRWGQIKRKKLGITAGDAPKKAATPAKKRTGGEDGEAAPDEETVGSPTPTKKARKPKAKSEPKVKEEEMEDAAKDGEGEDFGVDGEE